MPLVVPRKYKFPHYTPHEALVLGHFIDRKLLVGDYSFSVKLRSHMPDIPTDVPESVREDFRHLLAKRIDAVCKRADAIWILEIKRRLFASAIGELMMYSLLYKDEFKPNLPIKLACVAGVDDKATHWAMDQLGINVWITNEDPKEFW